MIVLAGGDLVLPDRIVNGGSLVIDAGRIVAIEPRRLDASAGATVVPVDRHTIVPGFVDVHVHGVAGVDGLDGASAVADIARRLPRYGVTAFCPTSIACAPDVLGRFLAAVSEARATPAAAAARVLPAHLESNFINPDWKGAQPAECLRTFRVDGSQPRTAAAGDFDTHDVLAVIAAGRDDVGIVTIAPEVGDGVDLVRLLRDAGHLVSIGHSGATHAVARAAIEAGVTHATHLFNRMSPLSHREPGVVGAVLESSAVTAEVICDGFHVHPAVVALALQTKGLDRVMAITDGTAGSGLSVGARTRLGGREIVVTASAAALEDGTLAGSTLTMDGAFRMLVQRAALPVRVAAHLCATSPARQLGLTDTGRIEVGQRADLAVLDARLQVVQTYIAGTPALEPR